MMGRFGIPEDEPIQNRMVSRALENAQAKIEGLNFDARKHLLEYDDVMNHQRKIIYARRQAVLSGGREEIDEYLTMALVGRADEEDLRKALLAKEKEIGTSQFEVAARAIILQSIDTYWVEHLEVMEYLRSSVNLRAYGQRDPLVEYKREGLRLFRDLEASVFDQVLRVLPYIGSAVVKEETIALEAVHEEASQIAGESNKQIGPASHEAHEKIGRNDPCPCGSGKKYKHCGLINAPEHKN
jgi:preprotein translocase subunit SecA